MVFMFRKLTSLQRMEIQNFRRNNNIGKLISQNIDKFIVQLKVTE